MQGLGAHYELVVTCRGEVDPTHGYLINIKEIDQAVRAHAVPLIQEAINQPVPSLTSASDDEIHHSPLPTHQSPLTLVPDLFQSLSLPGLQSVRWKLSPYYSLEVTAPAPNTVLLRQKFDFCAAHRLHSPQLSPEENRRLFGKCNNPSGHGHNYQFEPCIALTLEPSPLTPQPSTPTLEPSTAHGGRVYNPPAFSLSDLERLADELIVQRFDHKNLNTDTDEFRDGPGGGLNPSVENIAKVCYALLAPAIDQAGRGGAKLQSVTVWESDRTSCTYPG